jgi:thioredoxin 1
MIKELKAANFQTEVLDSTRPAVVKFWSEGCYPCKMVGPVVEQFAEKYADKVMVGSVKAASNMDLVTKYEISGVPTIILFSGGQPAAQVVGYVDLEDLEEEFADYLG